MERRRWILTVTLAALLTACAEMPEVRPLYQAGGTEMTDDYSVAYANGKRDFAAGHFAKAASSFRTAVKLSPDDLPALNGLAATYDRLGRYDLADALYEHSLMVNPNDASSLNNLGYSLLLRGRKAEAVLMLRHAAKLAPEDPVVSSNLARAEHPAAQAEVLTEEPAPPPPPTHLTRLGSRVFQWISKGLSAEAPIAILGNEPPLPAIITPRVPVRVERLAAK